MSTTLSPNDRLLESPANPSPVLDQLLGYQARRAALHIIAQFHEDLKNLNLRPVTFSVMSLVGHQDGITAREVCTALGIQPPNVVGIVNDLCQRGWVERQPHPTDGRALGLHLTPAGQTMLAEAEGLAVASDRQVSAHLSANERQTLLRLLRKLRQA